MLPNIAGSVLQPSAAQLLHIQDLPGQWMVIEMEEANSCNGRASAQLTDWS